MAADPAYLIYEYDLQLKDLAMTEIGGDIPCNDIGEYQVSMYYDLFINDIRQDNTKDEFTSIEKVSYNEYRLVKIFDIVNIKESILDVKFKFRSLYIGDTWIARETMEKPVIHVDVGQQVDSKIVFDNKQEKILAEKKLTNKFTLYIEEITNSKFENYVLARTITDTMKVKELNKRNEEFMIEEPEFAICDQNDDTVNYSYVKLEEYYEKVVNDNVFEKCNIADLKDTELIRRQDLYLIKLGFDEGKIPEKIKILPINRKLYNDRNDSEEKFYKNEDWYQVKLGENSITEDSQIGGSVTITEVEQTDDKLIFYYENKGYVPDYIDFALRAKSEEKLNYINPREIKYKNINDTENKIIYPKDMYMLTGALPHYGNYQLDNVDDLEFALFYNVKYEVLSEALEFNWNVGGDDNAATLENVRVSEFLNDINDDVKDNYKTYSGYITSIDESYLKFYSNDKEYILSRPKEYKYSNGRTNENMDFSEIKVGDFFISFKCNELLETIYSRSYGEYERFQEENSFTIVKNVDGEELKKELLKELTFVSKRGLFVDNAYLGIGDIEVLNNEEATVIFEISNGYEQAFANDEKFEVKAKITKDTKLTEFSITDVKDPKQKDISFNDLKNIDYLYTVTMEFDEITLDDENPVITKICLVY